MTFGKYELLDSIGAGTIAEVFKAKSFGAEGFEKRLAVKRVQPDFSTDAAFGDAFVAETQTALLLNHGNIVQVFDLGRVDEQYFLAMELVQGESLFRVMADCRRQGRQFPLEIAVFIASEIAKGLDFAHRKRGRDLKPLNIVHQDLSAHNILLSIEGEVKISDFGLALAKQSVAEKIQLKRHPLYISPEQARRQPADKRSDIYCLGLLLYEMLTLRHPFKGVGRISIPPRAEKREYLPISKLRPTPEVPAAVTGVVDKCLSADPSERYPDAGALYETLIAELYRSTSRVSAHTVAAFLSEVLDGESSVSEFRPPKEKRLAAAFKSSIAPAVRETVARPSSTPPDEIAALGDSEPPAAVDAEMRDATLLTIDFKEAALSEFKLPPFVEIIENSGGVLVAAEGHLAHAVFGLDLTYGKETEEALAAAFKLKRAAVVQDPVKGEPVAVSVWPARVPLTEDDGYLAHESYKAALAKATTAAALATDGVVTSEKGTRLSSSAYQFEKLDAIWPEAPRRDIYQAIGRLTFMERRGRLLGRHGQLQTIGRIFSAAANGHGALLLVNGPRGVGKTRLIREGQWRLLSSGGDIGWFETHCVNWNKQAPFSGLADILRAVLALELITAPGEIEEKVDRLKELSLTEEELAAVSALLGLATDQDTTFLDSKRIFYSAMVQVIGGLCKDRLTVFVWDNADDLDPDTLGVLQKLGESLTDLPFVGILMFREPPRRGWEPDVPHIQSIALTPLPENDANRFALACIGVERGPNALLSRLYQATDGNPLRMETLIEALMDEGRFSVTSGKASITDEAALMRSTDLDDLLKQQLSALSEEEATLLQAAAIVGQRFNSKVLDKIIARDFADIKSTAMRLKKKGFLSRVSISEFVFSSKALWDVVRANIDEDRRRERHLELAEAFLKLFGNRTDYISARLATHFELGGDPVRAIEHYTLAGKRAAEGHTHRAALNFYIRAQDLLRTLPETEPDSLVAICVPIGELAIKANAYEIGLEKIQLAEWVSEQAADKLTLARVLMLTSELHAHCEHNVEVDWYLEWAMDLARELDDSDLSFDVLECGGRVYYLLGDMRKAAPKLKAAIDSATEHTDRDRLIACMAKLSRVEASAGELENAMKILAGAENLLDDTSDILTQCEIEQSRGRAFFMAGNTEKAIESHLRLLEIAKEYGLREYIANTAYMIGELYLERGENAKAFAYLNMSKETAEGIGLKNLVNISKLLLSYVDAVELGGGDQIEELERFLLDALEREAVWEQLHLLYYLSKIYMEKGLKSLAREHLARLIKLGGNLNNRLYFTKAEELLKELDALESIPAE